MKPLQTMYGTHRGKPCPFCGKPKDCRASACRKCHHEHKNDVHDGQTNGWAAKRVSRGKFREVEFTKPRLWADVIAGAKVQAQKADAYRQSTLNPVYDPEFGSQVSKLPEVE